MNRILGIALALMMVSCGGGKKNDGDAGEDVVDDGVADVADADDADDEEVVADAEPDVDPGLWLDVGDVVDLDGVEGSFTVDVAGPAEGGSYALVVMSAHWASGGVYSFTSSIEGGPGGTEELLPRLDPPVDDVLPSRHPVMTQGDYRKLMQWATENVQPLWEEWPSDPAPTVDEVREFQIQNASSAVVTIEAQCQYVNEEMAIWYDITSTPAPSISDLDEVALLYTDIVLPRDRYFFGQESDYNEDGVIHVLFSPYVAEVGASAYFHPCDLMEDPSPTMGCYYGNHAEMVYYAPPEGSMMGSPTAIAETLAHETSHLIYFYRKFLLNDMATTMENVYVTEAGAALAQDLSGMAAGNFFVTRYGLEQIEEFRVLDILQPSYGYDPTRDGSLRGNSYLFLRYLYDMNGGDEVQSDGSFVDTGGVAWLNGWVDSADVGTSNVVLRMGEREINDIAFDFYTCLIMSNRGPDSSPITDEPAYNFLPTVVDPLTDRVRGADMFRNFRDMFQLTGPATAPIDAHDGTLFSTGVQYLTFEADGSVTVTVDVDPDAEPWVRLVRLQ